MEYRSLNLNGVLEIIPRKIGDERGYFAETFRLNDFESHSSSARFVQENQSLSVRPGTIRGIHFQSPPAAQGKLVRCIVGLLFDVAVDLRHGSPSYGRWISRILSPHELNQLWVPAGFGHGFCTLEPNTIISYRVTDYYSPEHDHGLAWDDPDVAIAWPDIADPSTLSERDRYHSSLAELPAYFTGEES
jgi:dTDP-4-dehydrorhamnose 3,5-epimerase